MESKELLAQFKELESKGLINEEARLALAGMIERVAGECAAMRATMEMLLSVMDEEEGGDGIFSQAISWLKESDLGLSELEYRQALESKAAKVIQSLGSDVDTSDLAGILDQTPSLFLKRDEVEQYIEKVVRQGIEKIDIRQITARGSEFGARSYLQAKVKEIIFDSFEVTIDFTVDDESNPHKRSVYIDVVPRQLERSKATIEKEIEGELKDRLYWLLSDVTCEAMDHDIDNAESFADLAMDALKEKLAFQFDRIESKGSTSTTFGIRLKDE